MQSVRRALDTDIFELGVALATHAQLHLQALLRFNLKVHEAAIVKEWLKDKSDRIELAFLPPYTPEFNPDEYMNSDFKTNLRLGAVRENQEQLLEKANAFMGNLATWSERVRPYFQHPSAKYATRPV